ncbi:MAG: response regulator [Chloroflexota bacterium]
MRSHSPRPISVLLVDDQRLLREGLRTLLELHPDIQVIGEAGDGIEAELSVERFRPSVVLMDLRMPRQDGVATTRRLTARFPEVHVLVLTTFDDEELVLSSLAAGAQGYLLKDVGSDALAEAIRAVARDESPLQPRVAGTVLRLLRDRGTSHSAPGEIPLPPGESLTQRELDVLRLLGSGASNRQIADTLALTEGTVKNYVSAVLNKTGLHDRTQLALLAVRHGLAEA